MRSDLTLPLTTPAILPDRKSVIPPWLLLSMAVLMLFLAAGLATFAFKAVSSMTLLDELDYGEGILMWQALHVTDLKQAFRPVETYPHIVFHYPPLYHLASRAMTPVTGNLLTAGRLVSILSLLGTCLMLGLLTLMCFPSGSGRALRYITSFSAAGFIFTLPTSPWGTFMRVDTLAMLLVFSGLALFIVAKGRPWLAFAAFACFLAAVYTKQTMIAAPAACLLLAFLETPRLAVRLLVFTIASGLSILTAMYFLTDGGFLLHLFGYNQNPFSLTRLVRFWIEHISLSTALLSVAIMFPLAVFRLRRVGLPTLIQRFRNALGGTMFERCATVATLHFWFAAVVTLTVGKEGSYYNYFFELDLSLSLLSGLFVGWLLSHPTTRQRGPYALLAVLVVPLLLLHSVRTLQAFRDTTARFFRPVETYSTELVEFVRTLPGPVYSEDMTILMRAGKGISAEPAIITCLAKLGKWDETPFVRRIEEGQFQAIIIYTTLDNRERFTEAVERAIEQRYILSKEQGLYSIYLPR